MFSWMLICYMGCLGFVVIIIILCCVCFVDIVTVLLF